MATSWQISGDYFETCSCTFLCPCLPSNFAAQPTKGDCYFGFVWHIERGRHGNVALDGLNFAVVGLAPGPFGAGNLSVGVVLDERATPEQQQAITAIASGQAGGPMAALAPLIGKFLGTQVKPIHYQKNGMTRSVSIPGALDQAVEGVASPAKPGEPLYLDNTAHPVNPRMALAHALRSHLNAFGLKWDDVSGQNNGHFAPFSWQGS
jgi:hypothetical protein